MAESMYFGPDNHSQRTKKMLVECCTLDWIFIRRKCTSTAIFPIRWQKTLQKTVENGQFDAEKPIEKLKWTIEINLSRYKLRSEWSSFNFYTDDVSSTDHRTFCIDYVAGRPLFYSGATCTSGKCFKWISIHFFHKTATFTQNYCIIASEIYCFLFNKENYA